MNLDCLSRQLLYRVWQNLTRFCVCLIYVVAVAAVLPFSTLHPSPLTSPGSSTSILPQSNSTSSNSSENKPFQTLKETPKVTGGLVTGAPSPPDVKENVVTPQPTPDPAKVSKSLVLENGAETSCRRNTSSCSSPEANSCSCEEDELMITDHSPPAKNKVRNDKLQPDKTVFCNFSSKGTW